MMEDKRGRERVDTFPWSQVKLLREQIVTMENINEQRIDQ
jgi:hypothetical protein